MLKALAKDPVERYATAGDLANDLTLFLADQPIHARRPTLMPRLFKRAKRHWRAIAVAGLFTTLALCGLVGAALWSNSQLRAVNQRLAIEKDRADRLARQAQEQARQSGRHAHGAQLRLAAQAVAADQPERAQGILRDIPLNAGNEAPHSFVWRYLWRQARREIVVLVGPTPRFGGFGFSPDGTLLATSDGAAGLRLWDVGSGSWIRDLENGRDGAEFLTFSPAGTLLAAVCRRADGDSRDSFSIWEVATGLRLASLPLDGPFTFLACDFLPGGEFLGVAAVANTAPHVVGLVWKREDGQSHTWSFELPPGIFNIDSVSTGGMLLAGEGHGVIVPRDPRTGRPTRGLRLGGERTSRDWPARQAPSMSPPSPSRTGN